MENRLNPLDMYSNHAINQSKMVGGYSKKVSSYSPNTQEDKSVDKSVNKLLKENRLLNSKIEQLELKLKTEKQKNDKLQKQLDATKL